MSPELIEAIRDVGAIALVAYIIWYDHTKMIPGIIRRMSEENAAAREAFNNALKEQRDDFRDALKERRADFARFLNGQHNESADG